MVHVDTCIWSSGQKLAFVSKRPLGLPSTGHPEVVMKRRPPWSLVLILVMVMGPGPSPRFLLFLLHRDHQVHHHLQRHAGVEISAVTAGRALFKKPHPAPNCSPPRGHCRCRSTLSSRECDVNLTACRANNHAPVRSVDPGFLISVRQIQHVVDWLQANQTVL